MIAADVPVQPVAHHLNLTGQNILTIASWVLTGVLLLWTIQLGRKEKTPFYLFVVLASMVGAFVEPLYDEAMSLYFYTNGGLQSFWTSFNVPQPVWTHSGYAILYGLPAVLITRKVRNGTMTPQLLWAFALGELLESCAFEITGINMGTYTYWGPHVFRIAHYPLVIAVLEASQVMLFSVAAAQLRHRSTAGWHQLGLFAIFPVTMVGANFGAGSALIVAIHGQGATRTVITICTLVSMGLAVALVKLTSAMIPTGAPAVPADARDLVASQWQSPTRVSPAR